ncbi:hypothetical protein BC936DRAFT_139388 [Jimgerdemannia flammicorona]|nr:hypothetical protein BC936DRAFT_139388 [Jimgerdemannia flammicorona]
MDTRVVAVKQSQVELNKEIERLLAELQLFLNNTEPPSLQPAIIKLANARRRLTNANNILKNVHERVERLYAQLGKKPSVEG